jgi:hypothetical protein
VPWRDTNHFGRGLDGGGVLSGCPALSEAMPRLSRIVMPDVPHHVTQRGNRRQALSAEPGDDALYRDPMAERANPLPEG